MTQLEKPIRRSIALGETALSAVVIGTQLEQINLIRGFKVTVNGLVVEGNPSFSQFERVGKMLRVIERGVQFAIGDFVNQLEGRFGEDSAQILSADTGWSLKTIDVYRWMADRIRPEDRRMDRLGVAHHLEVAGLSREDQRRWLARAADSAEEPWTVRQLSHAIETSNSDVEPTYWVLVSAVSAADQDTLMETMVMEGRSVKAMLKRSAAKKIEAL